METRAAPEVLVQAAFTRRAARGDFLAAKSEPAREPLRFAAGLFRVQGRLATALLEEGGSLSGRLEADADRVGRGREALLGFVAECGPPGLAEAASALGREDPSRFSSRLLAFWRGDPQSRDDYLSRAWLRPYVEVLAGLGITPDRPRPPGHCPFCGGPPWIAARRSASEADGAERVLGCSLCGGEAPFARIRCPCCLQEDPERLPSFRSDTHPTVRIEACEACHRYVKSIDLTLDGHAIPEVDDLVSLGMDLWATREGFTRIEPGLAGI
jgi:FdhE protein